MRWPRNYQGKYASNKDGAVGICDFSSFNHNHNDLVKQMEWRGDKLTWTGFMVGQRFVDEPNEQLRPPKVQGDPYPVMYPRFPADFIEPDAVPALETADEIKLLRTYNMYTREYLIT